mgnify:CR=1 FL=1
MAASRFTAFLDTFDQALNRRGKQAERLVWAWWSELPNFMRIGPEDLAMFPS